MRRKEESRPVKAAYSPPKWRPVEEAESAHRAHRVEGNRLIAAATILSAIIGPVVESQLDDSAVESQNQLCEVAERRMAVENAGIDAWHEVELARIAADKEVELARIAAAVRVDTVTESPP